MKYTVAGKTQDVTNCECCGKTNLKSTVILIDENGKDVYFGSNCAAYALTGTKKNRKSVDWIASEIALAKKWLEDGFTKKQVMSGLGKRGLGAEIKNDILGVWYQKEFIAIA